MRSRFDGQLSLLNEKMISMGEQCVSVIELAAQAMYTADVSLAKEVIEQGAHIDAMEREIESICLKLLLSQQPVAKDLRVVSAALKMITDMERIGDQAEDIAEIITFLGGKTLAPAKDIRLMADTATQMVIRSVNAYVMQDVTAARAVVEEDDIVDDAFVRIKQHIIELISKNTADGEIAVDLLMIAKYFERIGDHATNIAEWVEYSVTGVHPKSE